MRPHLRPLAPTDVEAVVDFSLRVWAPVFASFRNVLGDAVYYRIYPDWRSSQAAAVAQVCRDASVPVWVAEVHQAPVGFVAIRFHDDPCSGEIEMLAVDPELQWQGVGAALTSLAVSEIRRSGVPLAVVATGGDPGHAAARRTYERAGFTGLPLVRYYAALNVDTLDE